MKSLDLKINWFELIEIAIPLSIMLITASLSLSDKEIILISIIFFVLTLIISGWQIYYYQRDFFIHQIYTIPLKNSMGPFLALSLGAIIYLLNFGHKVCNKYDKIKAIVYLIFIVGIFIGLYFSLVIRSRSALLGLICYIMIILIKRRRYTLSLIFLLALAIIIFFPGLKFSHYIIKPIIDSFTQNYDIYDLESLSAGRYVIYKEAFEIIKERPFLGISNSSMIFFGVPHNYLINKLLLYGLAGGFGFILLYLVIACHVSIRVLLYRPNLRNMGVFIFLIPLVVSLFEYTYPFGPGTANIFAFILLSREIIR